MPFSRRRTRLSVQALRKPILFGRAKVRNSTGYHIEGIRTDSSVLIDSFDLHFWRKTSFILIIFAVISLEYLEWFADWQTIWLIICIENQRFVFSEVLRRTWFGQTGQMDDICLKNWQMKLQKWNHIRSERIISDLLDFLMKFFCVYRRVLAENDTNLC